MLLDSRAYIYWIYNLLFIVNYFFIASQYSLVNSDEEQNKTKQKTKKLNDFTIYSSNLIITSIR